MEGKAQKWAEYRKKSQLTYLNNMDISYSDLNHWLQVLVWENKRPTQKVKYLEIPVAFPTN